MKVLITGKSGQLGRSINKIISKTKQNEKFTFVDRVELDLSCEDSINNYFKTHDFNVIVNCAAYTLVDKAEEEEKLADQINHQAVKLLAEISNKRKIILIHISTDYVFDGESNNIYKEVDPTNPINVYGKTKLSGEHTITSLMPTNAVIIRTSWLHSEFGNNFVGSILKNARKKNEIDVINDQFGSPTYAEDLAKAILVIIDSLTSKKSLIKTQIYHFSNDGQCSFYDFANEIIKLAKIKCHINPITTKQYASLAKRPKNTTMSKQKITKEFGLHIRHWKTSLINCIDNL